MLIHVATTTYEVRVTAGPMIHEGRRPSAAQSRQRVKS